MIFYIKEGDGFPIAPALNKGLTGTGKGLIALLLVTVATACQSPEKKTTLSFPAESQIVSKNTFPAFDTSVKTIHAFVALCDNKHQGIVPVAGIMGNGQNPGNNLYWGWGYGVRTYFKKSKEWELVNTRKIDSVILERLVFKHREKNYYLVADAYNGKHIKACTDHFLNSASGQLKDTLDTGRRTIGVYGNAKMLSFIGHNGLMDFSLPFVYEKADSDERDCIVLACFSKSYFHPYLKQAGVNPVLWTTGLMGPEAYTLHDALSGYINGESQEKIRSRAAEAYSRYTKCGLKAARNLLVTGP